MTLAETIEWEVPVDANEKCTELNTFRFFGPLPLPRCGRRRQTNPHMRAFWASTLCCTLAFIGWFAFAPLLTVVRVDIGLCDNDAEIQLLPEDERVDACVCQVSCKRTIDTANLAGVAFDIVTRFILGNIIERFGPVKTDCMLLSFGALVVTASAAVTSGPGLIAARFFLSCLGSTFVVNQFWNSIMFSTSVVGTANATAGRWGSLGGAVTQILMPLIYTFWRSGAGLSLSTAWRAAMLVLAMLYVLLATWVFTCSQDTTSGSFDVAVHGKQTRANLQDYLRVFSDYQVVLVIFQYSACFGCELVLNNFLAMHFKDMFGVNIVAAGALAMSFGGMKLFARSLGSVWSEWANSRWQMQGRLWTHFLSLLGQAVFLFFFGCIDEETGGWPVALVVLCVLSCFMNSAESTSHSIVPYMLPQDLEIVSTMVEAGGPLGAVICTYSFYRQLDSPLLSLKWHSFYVFFWALTVLALRWDHLGSMFGGVRLADQEGSDSPTEGKEAKETGEVPAQDSQV